MTKTKVKHKTTGKIGLVDFSVSYETIPEQFKVSWEDGTISYETRHSLEPATSEPKLTNNNQSLNNSRHYRGDDFEFELYGSHVFKLYCQGLVVINQEYNGVCRINSSDTVLLESGFYDYETGGYTGTIEILDPRC